MIQRKGLILLLFILFIDHAAWTQNPFIKLYTTSDGLPSNAVNIIREDKENFLWFATDAGLVRFDGSIFRRYTTRDGLSQNQVIVVKADSRNRVWLFCIGGRLNYCYQNKIYNRTNAPFLDSLNGNWNFSEDREGNLYFYNYNYRRIAVLDTADHVRWYMLPGMPLKDDPYTTDGMNIQYISRNKAGEFLIWTRIGMFKVAELGREPVQLTAFERYHDIFPVGDTFMYDVIAYPETQSSEIIKYIDGIPEDTVLFTHAALDSDCTIALDDKERMWISSPLKGIYFLENKKVIYHLDIKQVYWICFDHEGNLWANSTDGAYKISPNILYFKHFDNSKFNNQKIDDLSTDPEGVIWGLSGNLLFRYQDGSFQKTDLNYLNNNFIEVNALVNNAVLLTTNNNDHYAMQGIEISRADNSIKYNKVFPIYMEGGWGTITINKGRDEVCHFDRYNNLLNRYSVDADFKIIETLPVGRASDVFYDAKDRLMVLEGKEVYFYADGEKNPCQDFNKLPRALPLAHETLDSSADVFLTMYDSLYLVNQAGVFNLSSLFDYTLSTPVNRITYEDHTLFLATYRNIYKCDNPTGIIDNNAIPLHLIDINFTDVKDILARNDSLYVASNEGLTIIPVDKIKLITSRIPIPYFQRIVINDQEADIYAHRFSIKGKNRITVDFGSINYSDNPVMFSYMLEGYDEEWNVSSSKSMVYAYLPMGKYKLRLRAGKTNSPWSEPVDFEINIKYRFWQHPLFFVGLSFILAGLIAILVIYRNNLKVKRIEREHQLVTLEQKALQSMMNPHFLFNALGSIQHYLLQNKPGEAGLYLSQFARLIRQNIHSINNPMLSLEAETERLKNYLDLEKMRMKSRFDYNFEIAEDIEDDAVLIPSMVIQPFVENSILHGISPLERGGMIKISFTMISDKAIRIIIEDNGVGIEKSKAFKSDSPSHLHLSMEMTKKRIYILGKKYKVDTSLEVTEAFPTEANPGTRVTVVLPVSYGESMND